MSAVDAFRAKIFLKLSVTTSGICFASSAIAARIDAISAEIVGVAEVDPATDALGEAE